MAQNAYKYYSAWVDSGADAITVAITVLQGDADLYVSFKQPRPTSDKALHDWEARGSAECATVDCGNTIFNGDAVSISREDPRFCRRGEGGVSPCMVHIGVYGAQQSSFTALVTTSDAGTDAPVTLLDGQPIDATIAQAAHLRTLTQTLALTPTTNPKPNRSPNLDPNLNPDQL